MQRKPLLPKKLLPKRMKTISVFVSDSEWNAIKRVADKARKSMGDVLLMSFVSIAENVSKEIADKSKRRIISGSNN